MKKIKLGIIGTGIAAEHLHLPALLKLKSKIQIAKVCNHAEEKAKRFAKLAGSVPYATDYREILNDPGIDAVDILLPIVLNYKVTKEALKAGKHVLVEKPIAANLAEAKKMFKFPGEYNKVMMVAENFRYKKIFRKAKSLLDKNVIGKIYSLKYDVFHNVSENNMYAKTKWRKNHKYAGGFITDGGVHFIAGIRYLLGEITSGTAYAVSVNNKIGELDTLNLQFEMDNNVNGTFNMYYSSRGYQGDRVLIFGEKGTLEINGSKVFVRKEDKPVKEYDCKDDGGFYSELNNFYNAITKGEKIIGTFEEAYKDLNVVMGALKSAKTKKKVYFNNLSG
ncbi:MAG: Gfo/Idh/MocA family oxidoreductase [Ignavibacteria bacterium]|jgi:predicted dehydrogenase